MSETDTGQAGDEGNESGAAGLVDGAGGEAVQDQSNTGTGGDAGSEGSARLGAEGAKGSGDGAEGDAGEGGDGAGKGGAPEAYSPFKGPDGNPLPEAQQAEFARTAKELGLGQEQAQKYVESVHAAAKSEADQLSKTYQDLQQEWVAKAKADPEFGGEKFDENMKFVADAMKEFGTPELRDALKASGLGNHPEVVRLMYRVGKALEKEEDVVTGDGGSGESGDRLSRLYPSMASTS